MTLEAKAGTPILMGVVTGAHGVRGQVTVKSFAEAPEDLVAYGPLQDESGGRLFRPRLMGRTRGLLILAFEGLADRSAAQALRGTRLFLPRSALPDPEEPESYYHADLIGLRVEDRAGRLLGRVSAVDNHGAGDLLTLETPEGERLLPFTQAAVPEVDLAGGRLIAEPPEEILVHPDGGGEGKSEADRT
ncbi:MAG: ribosome maturation factor RimM [Rhodospirillales bacterium]